MVGKVIAQKYFIFRCARVPYCPDITLDSVSVMVVFGITARLAGENIEERASRSNQTPKCCFQSIFKAVKQDRYCSLLIHLLQRRNYSFGVPLDLLDERVTGQLTPWKPRVVPLLQDDN
ncbi:hypothetical protein K7X08_018270 [Anisodus acutangulus]|uniref:Uncharacterized protein n=1 Tax=Anisodus acutangulus TaxID=402998 RepID=A0A9Q1R9C7_9SOLA|nr:hypothetical protein K7X08_018270 [Anisodus acutangulus]